MQRRSAPPSPAPRPASRHAEDPPVHAQRPLTCARYPRGIMDQVSLAASLISAQMGRVQLEIAGKMLRMQANHDQSIGNMIDAAQHNIDSLSILASNLGGNVDIGV